MIHYGKQVSNLRKEICTRKQCFSLKQEDKENMETEHSKGTCNNGRNVITSYSIHYTKLYDLSLYTRHLRILRNTVTLIGIGIQTFSF